MSTQLARMYRIHWIVHEFKPEALNIQTLSSRSDAQMPSEVSRGVSSSSSTHELATPLSEKRILKSIDTSSHRRHLRQEDRHREKSHPS